MITQSFLKDRLNYNHETGAFKWIKFVNSRVKVGDFAGSYKPDGYHRIAILNRHYYAHRLAWLYVYGVMPKKEIDHINGNPSDNRILNLREANRFQNMANTKKKTNCVSGYKCVSWHKASNKWQARVSIDGKRVYLGIFDSKELAYLAYFEYAKKNHGVFFSET